MNVSVLVSIYDEIGLFTLTYSARYAYPPTQEYWRQRLTDYS